MPSRSLKDIVVSGIGVTSSIGQGKTDFMTALFEGKHCFDVMQRSGRQLPKTDNGEGHTAELTSAFLGAEISSLSMPDAVPRRLLRTASFSSQVALATLYEAWDDAALSSVDPEHIGLIIGGSNFQQRELTQVHDSYRERKSFLRPTYGMSFLDSDLCGVCTEAFGIHGLAFTAGGASASGQVAVLQAIQAVQSGQVDVCIAVGALMDISYWECQGFRSLGAMGSNRYAHDPASACRPFDRDRDGFIFGESCGVVVIEHADSANRSGVRPYARLAGCAMGMDGNRNPDPSLEGEISVINRALQGAGLSAVDIDYVNPHGTGSAIGDTTELDAIHQCGLDHVQINTTKSIIGHGLSAAGTVELVTVLLQMVEGRLHSSRNLENPIEPGLNWVRDKAITHDIRNALNLSMGFGGINTAVCLQKC